jgi:hypothetical protein
MIGIAMSPARVMARRAFVAMGSGEGDASGERRGGRGGCQVSVQAYDEGSVPSSRLNLLFHGASASEVLLIGGLRRFSAQVSASRQR